MEVAEDKTENIPESVSTDSDSMQQVEHEDMTEADEREPDGTKEKKEEEHDPSLEEGGMTTEISAQREEITPISLLITPTRGILVSAGFR